jgi:hypothetical protein
MEVFSPGNSFLRKQKGGLFIGRKIQGGGLKQGEVVRGEGKIE